MKKVIFLAVVASLVISATSRADIVYAVDSSRAVLNDGTTNLADTVKSDGSKLSVRGDAKAAKSWIKFDVTGLDIGSLTEAYLRITLNAPKDNTCFLSAVNDDYLTNIGWTESDLTWNNAPGNYSSSDGINPDDGSVTVAQFQDILNPTQTTLIGIVNYSEGTGGVAGQQYLIDVLSILQADTDGIVQFVLHGAGGDTSFSTHDHPLGAEYYPALVVVPEPATLVLLGLGGLMSLKKRR